MAMTSVDGAFDDYRQHPREHLPSNRSFAWVMAGAFSLLGSWPLIRSAPPRWWALATAVAFLLAGILTPASLTPLNRAWMVSAHFLGKIINPIVMAILFYGLFTPLAIVMRWNGRDALRFRFDPRATTYWQSRTANQIDSESLVNQF
jgi:hypothetical protein